MDRSKQRREKEHKRESKKGGRKERKRIADVRKEQVSTEEKMKGREGTRKKSGIEDRMKGFRQRGEIPPPKGGRRKRGEG